MKKLLLSCVFIATLSSCLTDEKSSRRILESEGYTDIRFTGFEFFGCSGDDIYSTGFTAKSPKGVTVKGVVCGGVLKGHTIRIF